MRAIITLAMLVGLGGCGSIYVTRYERTNDDIFMMSYNTKVESTVYLSIPAQLVADSNGKLTVAAPVITIGVVNYPSDKRYLYFRNSAWFNSAAEFGTTSYGLPSKSDTSSTQQVTAIFNALGQTASQIVGAIAEGGSAGLLQQLEQGTAEDRPSPLGTRCFKAFTKVVSKKGDSQPVDYSPFYAEVSIVSARRVDGDLEQLNKRLNELADSGSENIELKLELSNIEFSDDVSELQEAAKTSREFSGFVAYEPSPVMVKLGCREAGGTD